MTNDDSDTRKFPCQPPGWWLGEPKQIIQPDNTLRPKPLTEAQIRECWQECEQSAPIAFAQALQRKLGIVE